jgi:hypothetical protein
MDGATAPVSRSVVFIRQLVALGQTDMAGRAADRGRGRPRRTILSTLEPPNWFTCFVKIQIWLFKLKNLSFLSLEL